MSDLTAFQRGMIVGARRVGASVTTVANVMGVSRSTVSKVTSGYLESGQTASKRKTSCGRPSKLDSDDIIALRQIVTHKPNATAAEITEDMNQREKVPVGLVTIRRAMKANGLKTTRAVLIKRKRGIPRRKIGQPQPEVAIMVQTAIGALDEIGGSSVEAILKYMVVTYQVNEHKVSPLLKTYLRSAVICGTLVQTRCNGGSRAFMLADIQPDDPDSVAKPKKASKKKLVAENKHDPNALLHISPPNPIHNPIHPRTQ